MRTKIRASRVRIRRCAAVAIAAGSISLLPGPPVSASSPTDAPTSSQPAGTTGSGSDSGPSYSPPRLEPIAVIGAGLLVLVAIVWTLRRSGSSDPEPLEPTDATPEPVEPPSEPSNVPPADLSEG